MNTNTTEHANEITRFSPEERYNTLLIGSAWRGSIGEMVDEEMEREEYEPIDDEAYVPYVAPVAEDTHYHATAIKAATPFTPEWLAEMQASLDKVMLTCDKCRCKVPHLTKVALRKNAWLWVCPSCAAESN
jgi:hypothetical protein